MYLVAAITALGPFSIGNTLSTAQVVWRILALLAFEHATSAFSASQDIVVPWKRAHLPVERTPLACEMIADTQ